MRTDLDPLDVGVPNRGFQEGERSKADRQSIALVLDRQVMEGQPEQGQQQSGSDHHRNDDRLFTGQPGDNEKRDGRSEQDQTEGGLLRVGVGRRDHSSSDRRFPDRPEKSPGAHRKGLCESYQTGNDHNEPDPRDHSLYEQDAS